MKAVVRQLVATESQNKKEWGGILLLGAKFAKECGLYPGKPVTVTYGGKAYQSKMHSGKKGRIDGLSVMHKDFPDRFQVDDFIRAVYNPATNTIELTDIPG